jgi:hypothetical protein
MLRTGEAEHESAEAPIAPYEPTAHSLSAGWAWTLGVAWLLIYSIGVATTPAPADPTVDPPLVAVLTGTALLGVVLAMTLGLIRLRRAGAVFSLVGAGILLLDAVACPASGHHEWSAGWALFQLAGAVVLVGLSVRAVLSVKPDR